MEWVETTGRSVEEALEFALDELGVDEADAEYEVLEEPKTGLFGRLRTEARVRARVRPTTPRQKDDRRGGRGRKSAASPGGPQASDDAPGLPSDDVSAAAAGAASSSPSRGGAARRSGRLPTGSDRSKAKEQDVSDIEEDVPVAEQAEVGATFLRGVLERFGAPSADVTTHAVDEDTIEIRVDGGDLGLLIGPKGATLQSLQELTRTAVQRQTGARTGRILVDVSGYRQRRKEALERFAQKIADEVLAGGTRIVLEPMSPADRKIIHDTMNEIDGVSTSSEGEDPRRRVVVSPT